MQIKTETRVGLFVLVALGIFFYMTMQLGVFRLDRKNYKPQVVYFNDVTGLEKKADVKIAGVKVGWIEKIELIPNHKYKAKAHITIRKPYKLHSNSYAVVRQDGLLGTKYLEVIPGDPLLPEIKGGQALGQPGRSPVSMDKILFKVQEIAENVEDVTGSLRKTFGGVRGQNELQSTMDNLREAAEKFADFSVTIDRTLSRNESNINSIIHDFSNFTRDLKEDFPVFRSSIEKVADKIVSASNSLEDAALEARDGLKNINSVAQKIDDGKGLLGKLINEDETYHDLKIAVGGMKNYFAKIDRLGIIFDSHGEYYYRPSEDVDFEDAKGYFDIRIHPNDDHFYVIQLVGTQKGNLKRKSVLKNWYDENDNLIKPSEFFVPTRTLPELIGRIDTIERDLDQFKFGLQFGKIFKDVAVRFGLFESTVGLAVDFDIPFRTDKFRWVTSLEAFDFRGRDRIDDDRPHLKWINRVFILRNIYMAFGADDFVSKRNANGFFGAGLRFGDDDIKYIASRLGFDFLT